MTLADLQETCHAVAREHGWWDEDRSDAECIALMHSELSEALEAMRDGDPPSPKIPAWSSVEEELADVIIRVLDFAGARGLDLDGAVQAKIAYNCGRPYRHGRRF